MDKEKSKELLERMRRRFRLMLEADQTNRREALETMKFINEPGSQWDENMKKERGNRPCYEFNKLRVTCKRIINDMRANRPQGKVRAVEGGDKGTADIIEGLARNIWNMSDGDTISDYAAEYQVSAGYGAWRIVTDYSSDMAFDQDILIKEIQNPFCLFSDPSSKDMLKRDASDWILTEKITKGAYEKLAKGKEVVEWESHEFDDDEEWQDNEEVRVAEYWYKEPTTKEIWQLEDGKVVDAESDEAQSILTDAPELIKKRRTIQTDKIMMILASGDSILEGPTEWAGTMFPFIPVYGEYMVIDGVVRWYGAGQWGKDAQRSYNVSRTAITETIAQHPQSKYWVTAEQAKGHTEKWAEAHQKNFPFLLYNPDPKSPGAPTRMGPADIPTALIQESQLASEEINMVTGIYSNDVGAPNAANSGRQELVRNQQGQVATFNFQDNMAKGMKRTWELMLDLIPRVYDTERELRIIGTDGAEDYAKVNTFAPNGEKINDLSSGRYDTTITVGPSFSTQRQEAAEIYQQLLQGNPQVFPFIGDLVFKSMDLPYSEDIAERLQVMLPPEIQQMINNESGAPPEVMAMMAQARQAMQMVEQQMQVVQEQAQEAELAKSEVEKLMADLEKEQAKFEAKVATEMAKIAEKDARLTIEKLQSDSEGVMEESRQAATAAVAEFNAALSQDVAQVLSSIQQIAGQLNEAALGTMDEIKVERDKKPRITEVKMVRENGETKAVPVYEDDAA